MSLHRRLVPPSPTPPPSHSLSDTHAGAVGSSSTAFRGLGFPGVFDAIWSTNAVGGSSRSSWLPPESPYLVPSRPSSQQQSTSASLDSGNALLSSLGAPMVGRQDSW